MSSKSARLANNEAVFRAGNEAIDANRGDASAGEQREYLCECGNQECLERVMLTKEEYESVRADPKRFFVVPGHEDLTAGEVVVATLDRFLTVEKLGDEAAIVEQSNPRDRS